MTAYLVSTVKCEDALHVAKVTKHHARKHIAKMAGVFQLGSG